MATRPDIATINVDSTSFNFYHTNLNSATLTVKNIGLVTVYMRQAHNPDTVVIASAYPILPGETVYNVPGPDGGSGGTWELACNTAAGTSQVAIIGTATV